MSNGMVSVSIAREVFGEAERVAALDRVDVTTLLESLVRRHVEDVDTFKDNDDAIAVFRLDDYDMQRDEGESDEDYEARLSLFR